MSIIERLFFDYSCVIFCAPSQLEPLCDPIEPRRVFFDVVHFGDLRRGVPQQIRHLSRRQRLDRAIGLLDAVDERCGECVPDRVQALLLNARRFEDAVVAASEINGACVAAMLVGDQRRILAEVAFRAQVEDGVDRHLVQRHVALARRALELANFDLPAACELHAVAPRHLLHAALEVQHLFVEVDIAIEQTEDFAGAQPSVEHQRVCRRLLIDALAVAPCAVRLRLEPLDFLRRERRDGLAGGAVFFALRGEEVRLLDHRRRGHRVLLDQLLLREVAEVVREEVVDLLHRRVRIALVHPVVEQPSDIRRGHVTDHFAAEQGIDLVLRGAFQPVVAAALDGGELEDLQPVRHALFERFLRLVGLNNHLVERGDVVDHLFVDLCFGGAGEALAFSFAALVHVPHHASPATVGSDERVAVGEQLPLCHAVSRSFATANSITEGREMLSPQPGVIKEFIIVAAGQKLVFATSREAALF